MNYMCPDCRKELTRFDLIGAECSSCGFTWLKWNIIPEDDAKEHTESHLCECNPRLKFDAVTIIVHNSYDGREGVEWVNELLNQ
jgi:hypothetical protein